MDLASLCWLMSWLLNRFSSSSLQISGSIILFCSFERIHGRSVVFLKVDRGQEFRLTVELTRRRASEHPTEHQAVEKYAPAARVKRFVRRYRPYAPNCFK